MSAFRDPIAWEMTLPIRQSSPAWRASVKAFYGSPLDDDEFGLFRELAGREPPDGGSDELLVVAGRRSGKSEQIARLAVFEAVHGGHQVSLAPGQVALIPVISPLREQSGEVVRYCHGLASLPQVRPFVDGDPTRDGVRFTTGVEIRVMTADAVAVSGPTVVCGILDELSKFPGDDAAVPDREIINSLRPALAPLAGAPRRRLIGITSAYLRDGVAFETDRDHFGRDGADVLVVRGSTEQFNPSIDVAWLERERRRVGPRVFAREYLAEWQDAISGEGFIPLDAIESSIERGVFTRERDERFVYIVSMDPAHRRDRWGFSVTHAEKVPGEAAPRLVVDYAAALVPPKGGSISSEVGLRHAAELCREFGTWRVLTDQASIDPLTSIARHFGMHLVDRSWTPTNKGPRYHLVRDAFVSGRVKLIDNDELVRQLGNIQSELLRSGHERIEAARGHDDLADAMVLALSEAAKAARTTTPLPPAERARRAREHDLLLMHAFSPRSLDLSQYDLTAEESNALEDSGALVFDERDVVLRAGDRSRSPNRSYR